MTAMKKRAINIILILSMLQVFSMNLYSREEPAKIEPYVTLQYFKNTDEQRTLQTKLTYSFNRMEMPLPGMEIFFYEGTVQRKLLQKVITDSAGVAKLELGRDMKLKTDRDGMWAFSSEFEGNDTIESGTSELTLKDVIINMTLSEVDSIKTVSVTVFTVENGIEKPVSGEVVIVYVPRMFSLLPIGELNLDDAGTASLEFPSDLPGGKDGNLTIIAGFVDNSTFGNVEKRETIRWGLPIDYLPATHRALWTQKAPTWMIYTLSVLLAGVWGHYLFAVISLIRIKIDADRKARAEYRI